MIPVLLQMNPDEDRRCIISALYTHALVTITKERYAIWVVYIHIYGYLHQSRALINIQIPPCCCCIKNNLNKVAYVLITFCCTKS
jgi:hypothetical protein